MKRLTSIAVLALSLSLAACGKEEGKGSTPSGDPVAAVAAPAGTSWADTVNQTPEGHFVMGNPNAAVKVVEFGSYTCSHCAEFSKEASEEIRELVNTGKMNFEFRPFLRDPIDLTSALLARCGGKDVFFPMTEQFMANQQAMFETLQSNENALKAAETAPPAQRFGIIASALGFIEFAQQRGISESQAKQCLADSATAEKLAADVQKVSKEYDIQGTPSFVINGTLQENTSNWATLRAKLREAGI